MFDVTKQRLVGIIRFPFIMVGKQLVNYLRSIVFHIHLFVIYCNTNTKHNKR